MAGRIKHIAFILILAAMLLPAAQGLFGWFPERELHGDFTPKTRPELNDSTWFSGRYQEGFEPWLEENIGFHNGLVRLHNQLDYSLFHKPHADGVIRGKDGNLFEYDYIRAWMGKDFVGEALIDLKLRRFRYLQKHLKDVFNIDLVLVLEPGKASVYEGDIPEEYVKAESGRSNYDVVSRRASELGINLIDLNAWYKKIKDTSSYPVFPPQGTHWSEFAMWYAADSLITYIEEIRGIDLPEVVIDSIVYSNELRSTDYDQGITLNLIFELEHGPMPYPHFHFVEDSSHSKPNVLAVADSYYWNIFNTRIPKHLFNNEAFWYFYKKVYPDSYYGDKPVASLDIRREVEKQDVILYMATERFLYMIDRGFVDDLWGFYGLPQSRDELIRIKTKILIDPSWFGMLVDEADQKKQELARVLDRHAHYVFRQEKPEAYFSTYGPEAIMNDIRNNENWLHDLEEDAASKGIPLEERVMAEARYILEKDHPHALAKYDRIQQLMQNIRSDRAWYKYVSEKAKRYYMTEEEMLRAEAEYVFRMESEEH
ncbi:MAG: hypothetical protein V2I47_07940 [Bacteroidales bacterium]|jgi:hypothetical protein|nr:hypothetical protein [Bacteroidales bacterium]